MRNHGTIFAALVLCSLLVTACSGPATNRSGKPQITTVITSSHFIDQNPNLPRRIAYQCNAAECTSDDYGSITHNYFETTEAPDRAKGQILSFEDPLLGLARPIHRYMTSADYIATSTFLLPAEAGRHSTMIWASAFGTIKPPQGTLPPTTSWTGTAALMHLDMNRYSGTFNASFDGTYWEFSITDIASESGATINDLNWQEVSYSTDTHKIIGTHAYLLKGTVHGPNHDSVAITFDSATLRIVGTSVGHR